MKFGRFPRANSQNTATVISELRQPGFVRPERHQRLVPVGDAVEPKHDRDAADKGRGMAAVQNWMIFGHDARKFLR